MILETERLYLREMSQSDFKSLCKILQDKKQCMPMRVLSMIQKCRNGLINRFPDMKNSDLVYGP